jgi:hypothetical protein
VIDITSIEELFEHDGPLLAEDSDMYNFETYAAQPEPEQQEAEKVQQHVNKVMEQIKARKQDDVLPRFFDSGPEPSEQLVKDTMASLHAVQERMELRARAAAALEAAAQRAAATSNVKADKEDSSQKSQLEPAVAMRPPVVPGKAALAAAARCEARARQKADETLQDRISRVMAAAKSRTLTGQDTTVVHTGEHFEEQTTTASSYSATDSGSESGAEWQPSVFWGPAPR